MFRTPFSTFPSLFPTPPLLRRHLPDWSATDRVLIVSQVRQVRSPPARVWDLDLASVTSFYAAESEYSLCGLDRYIPRIPNRMTHSFPLRPYFYIYSWPRFVTILFRHISSPPQKWSPKLPKISFIKSGHFKSMRVYCCVIHDMKLIYRECCAKCIICMICMICINFTLKYVKTYAFVILLQLFVCLLRVFGVEFVVCLFKQMQELQWMMILS